MDGGRWGNKVKRSQAGRIGIAESAFARSQTHVHARTHVPVEKRIKETKVEREGVRVAYPVLATHTHKVNMGANGWMSMSCYFGTIGW